MRIGWSPALGNDDALKPWVLEKRVYSRAVKPYELVRHAHPSGYLARYATREQAQASADTLNRNEALS